MNNQLKFLEFKVSFIYGFVTKPNNDTFDDFEKSLYDKNQGLKLIRDGWCSTYQIDSESNKFIHFKEPTKRNFKIPACDNDNEKSRYWKFSKRELSGVLNQYYVVKKDGTGAFTLEFDLNKQDSYNTSDILRILSLVPRTIKGNYSSECTEVADDDMPKKPKTLSNTPDDCWDNLSFPFKIFVENMIKNSTTFSDSWDEIRLPGQRQKDFEGSPLYNELKFSSDPQIPYIYINAKIPHHLYKDSFLEQGLDMNKKRLNRQQYSKEIAAILGRWLNDNNIPYASGDYWELRELMKNGTFYSRYMNSLVFTTFSGLATLSLYPDIAGFDKQDHALVEKPIKITETSILRCLEFSRMRWHHAISINRELDNLIKKIVEKPNTKDFIPLLKKLIDLEETVALHLENPNSYLWDASVGSFIAEFLHSRVIENIEGELSKKLEHSRNLLDDKLKQTRTLDFVDRVLKQN